MPPRDRRPRHGGPGLLRRARRSPPDRRPRGLPATTPAPQVDAETGAIELRPFEALVDAILDAPPAPHLDRDAHGALSAGFAAGLLRSMAALEDDGAAPPTPASLPSTASFAEGGLRWRDGFRLDRLVVVDL